MFKKLVLIVALSATVSTATWKYSTENTWNTVNALCGQSGVGGGANQSPINIVRRSVTEVSSKEFKLYTNYWSKADLKIKNVGGHAHQVDGKWGYLTYGGTKYYTAQFHFHQPSEHTIDGMHYDAEMHIVHQNAAANGWTVLGFFFMLGDESPFLKHINYSKDITKDKTYGIHGDVNLMNLIDKVNDPDYGVFTYDGSFTTPPCTEGVNWVLFRKVLTMSKDQWDGYAKSLEDENISWASATGTIRHVQPLGTRKVYLRWGKIHNGEQRFKQVEIFGISLRALVLLIGFAAVATWVAHCCIRPKPANA